MRLDHRHRHETLRPALTGVASRTVGYRIDHLRQAVSHTGQTRETLAATTAAREAGAATVAITSFFRSPLTELCDHALVAGSLETRHQIEARASRLVHSALLDALAASVAAVHPDRTRIAGTTPPRSWPITVSDGHAGCPPTSTSTRGMPAGLTPSPSRPDRKHSGLPGEPHCRREGPDLRGPTRWVSRS